MAMGFGSGGLWFVDCAMRIARTRGTMVLASKYTGRTMEKHLVIPFDNNELFAYKAEGDRSAFSRLQPCLPITFIRLRIKKYWR